MFPSTFQRTMFPSFLGLHVTSSCSQPLETRKRGRGEYTTATHTYNPFQSPTPGDKGRQGEEERKVGREKRRTSTQSLHMISKELAVRFILSKHSPRTPLHTFTTHLHHSPSPPKLTTLAVVCCVSADSSPCWHALTSVEMWRSSPALQEVHPLPLPAKYH